MGIKNIFFQPGSFDKSLEKILEDSNFNVVNDCVVWKSSVLSADSMWVYE